MDQRNKPNNRSLKKQKQKPPQLPDNGISGVTSAYEGGRGRNRNNESNQNSDSINSRRLGPGGQSSKQFDQQMMDSSKFSAQTGQKSVNTRKKDKKKIERYESNSPDEEEFKEYFTNPVKRKEFDMQRKRQQVKEMHNINAFTLKSFNIKDKKALKEALPPYPDAIVRESDSQKNYATVALCCMSVTNPFRNRVIHLVTLNPWFDRIILLVIMVNCFFLALDNEVDIVTENGKAIDNIFLGIYTIEMILKVIAQGFVMRQYSYLRDGWNILDFVVVILGWAAFMIKGADNISAVKVIRLLRPLRTINQIPKMPSLVSTIMNSLPIMFDVMVLFSFMMIMFGTIATQLFGGHLEKRCTEILDGEKNIKLGYQQEIVMCQFDKDCTDLQPQGITSTCLYHGNPINETFSFDNILVSVMNIFQIITLEGWTDMMYIVRDVERTMVFDVFFLMCVVLGSFVILNLMVAVQASYLDQAFEEEDQLKKERDEKLKLKLKQQAQEAEDEEENEDTENNEEKEETEAGTKKKPGKEKKKSKGCCQCNLPGWYLRLQVKLEAFINDEEKKYFEKIITVLILFNTLFMSLEHYDQPEALTKASEIANLFFTVIFTFEMIIKLIGLGFKKYFSVGFNIFDSFIVMMSYVELLSPGDASGISVLRAFRLLRIFKIIQSWDSLKRLLKTVLESFTSIANLAVLIMLYLFISALLTKQFYTGQLLDTNGEKSRYNFSTTGDALVSVFIILTGENWNEIMIQVIVKEASFQPALLFIFLMVIGNWMLLNLFLAILLRALSSPEKDEEEEEEAIEEQPEDLIEADQTADLSLKKQETTMIKQNILDSSNSNIDMEFEIIKEQIIAISKGLMDPSGQNQTPKAIVPQKMESDEDKEESMVSVSLSDDSEKEKKKREKKKTENEKKKKKESEKKKKDKDLDEFKEEQEDEKEKKPGSSLYLFSHKNKFRVFIKQILLNPYFDGFIYHMIAINSLLLVLDSPSLEDEYQKKTINSLLGIISYIFIAECLVKIIAAGFVFGPTTYLKDGWNVLDFVIVVFSILTIVFEAMLDSDVSFIKGFRSLRALRPLKVVSKNEGIKTVVNAIFQSIPSLFQVLLIVLLFLLVFGILGIQLFMGQIGYCNDLDPTIEWRKQCIGDYTTTQIYPNMTSYQQETPREWIVPFNNYDNVFRSMITFFEISTLEMWPGFMYSAVDSVDYDHIPSLNNKKIVSIVYIVYIFVTTFFIMNLFVSVIVDKFNDEIKKRQGADNFTDEQKEWVKIQRLLVMTNPKIIPVEPINRLRITCFKLVQSQAFEYIVMTAIVINTLFMCVDHYGDTMTKQLENILTSSNSFFVFFFTIEMVLKLTAYGFKYYWYVNWNKFDFIIVILSLVAIDESLLQDKLGINVTALRIIRITRLLRMVKTSQGLRTLLKTLFMSLGNILNTALLLFLILFTFSVAGMSLFANVPEGDFINKNVNFRSFYLSFMTLWRAATGESWNGIMHDCFEQEGAIAVIFWLFFQLVAFFIFMNVFIAVIGESFNDNQSTEDENDILALKKKDIKAFQNTWAKYNPMGELFMKTLRLPEFLRELPPPLGYLGIRIEESKLNKIIFCLNIRDHYGKVFYPEVMWAVFHSIAGMNDEKVLKCEQIKNILKIVKIKYKGLGKKINLDQLCGNKYYRKDLTAVKYIQAIKILNRWRAFKDSAKRTKEREEMTQQIMSSKVKINNEEGRGHSHANEQQLNDAVDVKQIRVQNLQKNIEDNRRDEAKNHRGLRDEEEEEDEDYQNDFDKTKQMPDRAARGNYEKSHDRDESFSRSESLELENERNPQTARGKNKMMQENRNRSTQNRGNRRN